MDKMTKVIVGILVACIVVISVFLVKKYALESAETEGYIVNNSTNEVNNVDNSVNEIVENKVVTNLVNEAENKVTEPVKKEENKVQDVDANSEIQGNNDEERAVAIVKKDWGSSDGVAFRMEQVNPDGTYVISVRDENSVALEWYTVNPKTGEFSK